MEFKCKIVILLLTFVLSSTLALTVGHETIGRWVADFFIQTSPHFVAFDENNEGKLPKPNGIYYNSPSNILDDFPDLESLNIMLPLKFEHLWADWRVPFPAKNRTDLPIFWQIPKGGFSVVQRILSQCLNFVEVSEQGANHDEPELRISQTEGGTRYVNVDPTTVTGLRRATDLGLVRSGFADVMFTPLIHEATSVFSVGYHGRFFALFRHPTERAMGMYYAARRRDPSVIHMSITEFARTRLPNNELVRTLSGKNDVEVITEDDLYLAMELLRRKCVVGLISRMEESMSRFYAAFGWHLMFNERAKKCQTDMLVPAINTIVHDASESFLPKGEALMEIERQNILDLKLYQYILHLYEIQGGNVASKKLVGYVNPGFRGSVD